VKLLFYAAKKFQSTFNQCSPAVKNTLFHANVCLPVVEEIHTD